MRAVAGACRSLSFTCATESLIPTRSRLTSRRLPRSGPHDRLAIYGFVIYRAGRARWLIGLLSVVIAVAAIVAVSFRHRHYAVGLPASVSESGRPGPIWKSSVRGTVRLARERG